MNLFFGALFCALLAVNGVHSLNGGTAAVAGQFPAQASISLPNNVLCGGTIINANHIVTAANCVLNANRELLPTSALLVRAGSNTLATGTPSIGVEAIYIHPEFSPFSYENDVAVIRVAVNFTFNLNDPVPSLAAALFNARIIPDGTPCQVVGWNPITPAIQQQQLQVLTVPVLSRTATCNAALNHGGRVLDSMVCAGNILAAQGGICNSTRGGGLYCNGLFSGIASFGFGCGAANNPGVYTQTRMQYNWINAQLARTDIPPAGPTHPPNVPTPPQPGNASTLTLSMFLVLMAFLFNLL